MNQHTRTIRRLSALMVAFQLAAPAAGLEPGEGFEPGRSATVDSAGLDASRLPDAEMLYARIQAAAHSVCRADKAVWDGKAVLHQRLCIAAAVENAIARVDEPILTAVHRASRERLAVR
jgi:UrcA family protein